MYLCIPVSISIFDFRCGYATVHNIFDKTLEDRMESFFLSETCKYLFLVSIPSPDLAKVSFDDDVF